MVIANSAMTPRGSAGDGWKVAVNTAAADAAFSQTDPPQVATSGLVNLSLNRFAVLRAFLYDALGSSAAGRTATVDVYGWQNGCRRPILLARIVFTGGASQGVTPGPTPTAGISAVDATTNEADTATRSSGLAAIDVRSYADGSCLVFVDAFECNQIFLRVESISANTRAIVLAKGSADIPARVDSVFAGQMTASAATLTDAILDDLAGTDVPAAGSGQQYVLQKGEISNGSTAQTLTIHTETSAGGVLWGPHTIPANSLVSIDFGDQPVGDNKQIRISTGGNFTGRITLRGVKRPA